MAKLREAGLVDVSKSGIWAYYRLASRLDPRTSALLDVLV
jgi:DNA-binding transcriptional ArsR family regulator